MKKYIYIIVLLLIIFQLTACKDNVDIEGPLLIDSETSTSTPTQSLQLQKESPPMNIILARTSDDKMTEDAVSDWESYIKDKYGIDISLLYVRSYSQSEVMRDRTKKVGVDMAEMEELKEAGGFIYLSSVTELKKLAASGLIVPVNEYLQDLPVMANLDDSIKKTFTDRDGNLWAFPVYQGHFTSCMVYDGIWIEKFQKDAPSDLDSYLKLAEFIKSQDADTYMQVFTYSSVLSEFNQIFKAYGCYPDLSWAIGYNPQLGIYENAVLNENFPEAIRYIKYLYDKGLVYDLNQGDAETNPKVVTARNGADSTKFFDNPIPCYYLEGSNSTELIEVKSNPMCMAVLEGTEEVVEKLQAFVDMVLSDRDYYMDLFAGIKGEYYEEFETYYTYKRTDEEGNDVNIPSILVKLGNAEQKPYYASDTEDISAFVKFKEQTWDYTRDVGQFLGSNLVFSRGLSDYETRINELNKNIVQYTNLLMKAIIIDGAEIDESIAEYQEQVKYVTKQLEEINFGN